MLLKNSHFYLVLMYKVFAPRLPDNFFFFFSRCNGLFSPEATGEDMTGTLPGCKQEKTLQLTVISVLSPAAKIALQHSTLTSNPRKIKMISSSALRFFLGNQNKAGSFWNYSIGCDFTTTFAATKRRYDEREKISKITFVHLFLHIKTPYV